jgi:archaellum component FlaF (FlaF/FlaG flagellin family)
MSNHFHLTKQRQIKLIITSATLIISALAGTSVLADTYSQSWGELLVAKSVTINGVPASSGLTVTSGSRIKTGLGGRVIVNLSNLGKVTLGPDSEMILTFKESTIGGELVSGWAAISSPKGVKVAPTTMDVAVLAEGNQPSMLTVDVTGGSTRVESSGATLFAGNKKEYLTVGEELEVGKVSDGAEAIFERRPGTFENSRISNSTASGQGLGSLLKTGVRGTVEGVTLDHTQALRANATVSLSRNVKQPTSSDYMLVNAASSPSIVTCGDFNENCANCSIQPDLVKAKPKCSIGFNVSFINVAADSVVSVRPFFGNACFTITPGFPQQVAIPPGGAYPFQLNAISCPNNAGQLPQNSQIVIESNTCGTRTVMVEWAPPCR